MQEIVLVIHLILAAGLVAFVLFQRSEGGALGIGGGGGQGGMMSSRGTANFLTKMTTFLAASFFVTSLTLAVLAKQSGESGSVLDVPVVEAPLGTIPEEKEIPAVPETE